MTRITGLPPGDRATIDHLLDRSDLAKLFKVTEQTIQRWEKAGRLPAPVRLGRKPLWPADVVRGHLDPGETRK